jgi:hypothetical protein
MAEDSWECGRGWVSRMNAQARMPDAAVKTAATATASSRLGEGGGDAAPLLETAGFAVDSYKESAGWADRVPAAFGAGMEAMPTLTDEMGEAAAASLQMEVAVTPQFQPHRCRVIVHARRLER